MKLTRKQIALETARLDAIEGKPVDMEAWMQQVEMRLAALESKSPAQIKSPGQPGFFESVFSFGGYGDGIN